MELAVPLLAALLAAQPPAPAPRQDPPKSVSGTGLLVVGGVSKALGFAGGITGVVLGGSPGAFVTLVSTVPSALGGGTMVAGAWLRGRHQAAYRVDDLGRRVRPARITGWTLVGIGAAMLVGGAVAYAVWPYYPAVDEGAAARYPGAFAAVGAIYSVGPLLIGSGASAVAWSSSYARQRAGPRVVVEPTLGGLRLRF